VSKLAVVVAGTFPVPAYCPGDSVGMIPIGAELPKSSLWTRAFFLFSQFQ
jgi:hypothetical protein